jgi:hypothetical protein
MPQKSTGTGTKHSHLSGSRRRVLDYTANDEVTEARARRREMLGWPKFQITFAAV